MTDIIEPAGNRFAGAVCIESMRDSVCGHGYQRTFQQPLRVNNKVVALGTKQSTKSMQLIPDGRLERPMAPPAHCNGYHPANRRMQPHDFGEGLLDHPVDYRFRETA